MDKGKEYFWQYKDLKKRIEVILKNYRATVDYYYSDLKDSNPNYFKMYNSAKVRFVVFHNNPTWSGVAFYFGANEKPEDEIKEVDLPVDYISSYSNIPGNKIGNLIAKKLHILDSLYKEPIMMPKVNILAFTNDGSLGQSFANEEAKNWKNDSTTSIDDGRINEDQFVAPNIELPASILAYRSLLDNIDNDELSFEVEEAVSCYKHKEYLACALVLSRALEWSCKLLLDTEDPEIYSGLPAGSRSLNSLANQLESHRLIDSYEHNQLKASIDYRNSIAHATPITQIRNIIQHIFEGIHLIVQKIIDSRND
ncbi:hypothetical protein [uncultured Limosilactobacillus sp.]|uniref:hypothetical protein n=1 Tax=uncultured Limosilactobacillus sp. TaxID=2837629 RepID=UPI0025D86037|nr:hypothetical protein [uncultured Limosilactobacillus sp.]